MTVPGSDLHVNGQVCVCAQACMYAVHTYVREYTHIMCVKHV